MFIRLNQFHPDGRLSPLLCNIKHINNVQERFNAPTGAAVMDPTTKEFPTAKMGSAITFNNSHAFVAETVDEVFAIIRNDARRNLTVIRALSGAYYVAENASLQKAEDVFVSAEDDEAVEGLAL